MVGGSVESFDRRPLAVTALLMSRVSILVLIINILSQSGEEKGLR